LKCCDQNLCPFFIKENEVSFKKQTSKIAKLHATVSLE